MFTQDSLLNSNEFVIKKGPVFHAKHLQRSSIELAVKGIKTAKETLENQNWLVIFTTEGLTGD